MTAAEVARQEGVSAQRYMLGATKPEHQDARARKTSTSEHWSAEAKLAVIIETAALSESELSLYCREKGLLVEQIKDWKESCLTGFQTSK